MPLEDITPQITQVAHHYQYSKPPDFLIALQDVIAGLLRWLADFLHSLHIATPGLSDTRLVGSVMQLALYAAGMTCGLVFIALVWSRFRNLQKQSHLAKRKSTVSQFPLDSHAWQQEAFTQAQQGNWSLACRALHLCLLRQLDERQLVTFAPAKTNYEYGHALAQYPLLQSAFRRLSSTVEQVWFGNRQASLDDFELCLSQLTTAKQELQQDITEGAAGF